MITEVRRLIDALADELQRSVVLNDVDVHLLHASRHFGDEDEVRIKAALYRDAGSRAIAHLLAQGVHAGSRAGRIPPAPELGMRARLLVPVRWHGELLGSVVVIDDDQSMTEDQVLRAEDIVKEVAGLIVSERHATNRRALADEQDVRRWLSGDPGTRVAGRDGLVSRGLLPDLGHLRVFVVGAAPPHPVGSPVCAVPDQSETGRVEGAIRHALSSARGSVRGRALSSVQDGRGALVVASPVEIGDRQTEVVAERLHRGVVDFLGDEQWVRVGVGTEVRSLDLVWTSYRQADLAASAAPYLDGSGVRRWETLGVLQVLARIPPSELDETAVPAALTALRRYDPDGRLLRTLEAYLRHGGAGTATAASLHVHRTTLYYRLDRIRDIIGLDVDDGDVRLVLHLGIVVDRMRRAP